MNQINTTNNRWMSFEKLPTDVQQRLLTLQNNDGDYLQRKKMGASYYVILLVILTLSFIPLLFGGGIIIENASVLFGSWLLTTFAIIILIWIIYVIRKMTQEGKRQLQQFYYVTPMQLIDIFRGDVKYYNLADFTDIKSVGVMKKGVTQYYELKFYQADGNYLSYPISSNFTVGRNNSEQEAEHWKTKIKSWIDYAKLATKENNSAYLNSWDIFKGVPADNAEIFKETSQVLPRLKLIGISFSVFFVSICGLAAVQFFINKNEDSEKWQRVSESKKVTQYLWYLHFLPNGLHIREAEEKVNSIYDEEIKKTTANKTSTVDTNSIETLVTVLENAKKVRDNQVFLKISDFSQNPLEDFKKKITDKFTANFPDETLLLSNDSVSSYAYGRNPTLTIDLYQPKTPNNSAARFDINCDITLENKRLNKLELKSATFDEFLAEFSKRFGFDK